MSFLDGGFGLRDKFRTRVKNRPSFLKIFSGSEGSVKRLDRAKSRVDSVTERVKEGRPKVITRVDEALSTWNVGRRVTELLPGVKTMKETGVSERPSVDGIGGNKSIRTRTGIDISVEPN